MKPIRNFHGFIIDADNTIFDFDKSEREAFYDTMLSFKIDADTDSLFQSYIKINDKVWDQLERGEIGWKELNLKRFTELFEGEKGVILENTDPERIARKYLETLSQKTYIFPKAVETLSFLSRRADLILSTNGIATVQRSRIARSGIEIFFKDIVISEEIGISKPDRQFFEIAIQKLGISRDKILCVGDSITSDIIGGYTAGLSTCLVLNNSYSNTLFSTGYKVEYKSVEYDIETICDYTIETIEKLKQFAPMLA